MNRVALGSGIVVSLIVTAPLWFGVCGHCPLAPDQYSPLSAKAVPAFARRYNADCTLCHSVWPRLNRTGYEFRRLGFRMPYEVSPNRTQSPSATKGSPKAPVSGQQLFERAGCIACHPDGGNIVNAAKPLKGAAFPSKYPDDDSIAKVVRAGIKGSAMPSYDETKISSSDLNSIIKYIRSLTQANQ